MREISDFINRFDANISLDEASLVKKQGRCFLLDKSLKRLISEEFFYAGTFLGKTKKGIFFPSFYLLAMINKGKANKILVDAKTEWLFICGRDIFRQGITRIIGSYKCGDYALILNRRGECIGFGKILSDLDKEKKNGVVVENILDLGDFLRREK
jgi:ribosome biogenesis protein Nip4